VAGAEFAGLGDDREGAPHLHLVIEELAAEFGLESRA
jgi:hypothetical protein